MKRYLKAQAIRQEILNLLADKPGLSAPTIRDSINMRRSLCGNYLRWMIDLGEIRSTGSGLGLKYYAVKEKTVSAQVMYEKTYVNKEKQHIVKDLVTVVKGARTIHKGTERDRPIRCPDAMGSRGIRFGMQSSMEFI